MELETLKEMILRLEEAGGTVHLDEYEDEPVVDELEGELNLQFPDSFKAFFRVYEYLQIGSNEFVWIKDLPLTVNKVRARYPQTPENYLPVLRDDLGGYYYLVCARQGEPRPSDFGAVTYNPAGAPGVYEFTSPDFLDFVAMKVTEEMDAV